MKLIPRMSSSRHLAWVGAQTPVLDEPIQERPKALRDEGEMRIWDHNELKLTFRASLKLESIASSRNDFLACMTTPS